MGLVLTVFEIHVLHEAFLWFYHAISYESIGLIAHNFSNNKLLFLDSARNSFNSALRVLPLPYVSTEIGVYVQSEYSPLPLVFATPSLRKTRETNHNASPTTRDPDFPQSASSSSIYSTASAVSEPRTVLDIDDESARRNEDRDLSTPRTHTEEKESSKSNQLTTPATPTTHKSRLDHSLSFTHLLEDELVPSPLFSRASKQARLNQPDTDTVSRPLPPLPFNHKSNFNVQGTRLIQDPLMRKTAVQTLIARFEGHLPLSQSPLPQSPQSAPSPMTPRFRAIRDAFSPNPHNEHLEAFLSTASLTRYNASLADFRAQLRKHIAFLDEELTRVQTVQAERTATKALSKNRFASFWSFEHAALSARSKSTSKSKAKSRSPAAPKRPRGDGNGRENESDNEDDGFQDGAKKERIEKLRREGWSVRKEKHGYKGMEWYEELRIRVERELEGDCGTSRTRGNTYSSRC